MTGAGGVPAGQTLKIAFVTLKCRRSCTDAAASSTRNSLGLHAKAGHRGTEVRLRGVPEFRHEGMVFQCLLHDAALNALAASVNQPHLAQACFVCRGHVLGDDGGDVARREGVEVDRVFDGNLQDGYLAVTIVFMPPRTAKSPTTVMRFG